MAEILKAISHPVRLEVLELLEEKQPQSVGEILEQIDVEPSLLSHHLTKMKDKGVLDSFRDGRNIYYQLAFEEVTKIFDCMENCDFL
ncbi:MAG: helix-turn-helix transcriptional regulator [Phaeodactylibacter sp.]|nr:helix-turn-helix transcriptional regulator [Phaeodactylibacter sp.]